MPLQPLTQNTMEDLIKALQILLKYGNPIYPFHCEHDVLTIVGIEPEIISDDDRVALEEIGFIIELEGEVNEEEEIEYDESKIYSYKYGSC
jgi:hypothetical protein